jgi:hypothetical protein
LDKLKDNCDLRLTEQLPTMGAFFMGKKKKIKGVKKNKKYQAMLKGK